VSDLLIDKLMQLAVLLTVFIVFILIWDAISRITGHTGKKSVRKKEVVTKLSLTSQ
jgi:hypothetical protein